MIDTLTSTPFFGLGVTLLCWYLAVRFQKRTGLLICNPVLVASLLVIGIMLLFHIPLDNYNAGGSIINMGSNSAWQPVPYQAVYGASKSYVLSLSRAIGRELRPQGIHVMCVCPGWIKTEFQQVAHHDEYIRYVDKWYGPDEVAAQAMQDLKKKKSVSILGHPVRRQVRLVKLLPVDTVMDIWCKQQGIE